jgi:hypothetical protein
MSGISRITLRQDNHVRVPDPAGVGFVLVRLLADIRPLNYNQGHDKP